MPQANVESLDQEGRGIARHEEKVVFIHGALPGETVEFSVFRKNPSFDLANATRIVKPSAYRVAPRCRYFGTCGGCSLQHLDSNAQVAVKQRVLEDALARLGKVKPDVILPAIYGEAWGYRARARLAARLVEKKGGVLAGFHEKRSSFIADMESCEVLPEKLSSLLKPLRELLGELSISNRVPQIEVAVTEDATALSLRILGLLSDKDLALLRDFARSHEVVFHVQPGGPESVRPLNGEGALKYSLREFDVTLSFTPSDFTQVNPAINRVLVRRAVTLLDPRPRESIADFFCGIGNFSLPLARRGANVTGYEGNASLVARAQDNAKRNGLNATFICRDLYADEIAEISRFDKVLLDPPRDGAIELVKAVSAEGPKRVVYVSCSPATLARDAAVLVHTKGYRLQAAGVVNMFPQTSHVESIALFER
ncbi:MAG: 23S rRNA (uracil(1939)-C(5))-methyltransferase RlmD [Burkholderiales bacterium]